MNHRGLRLTAWLLGILCLGLAAGSVVFAVMSTSKRSELEPLIFFVACALIGSLIASRQPGNLVGWLMLGGALSFTLLSFTGYYALYGLAERPHTLPGATIMAWPQTWLWIPGAVLLFLLLPMYFPNGRLPSLRWRWLVRLVIAAAAVMAMVAAILPGGELIQIRGDNAAIVNPLSISAVQSRIPESVPWLINIVGPVLTFGMLCGAVASLLVRFRHAEGVERQQLKWFALTTTSFPILIVLDTLLQLPDLLAGLGLMLIPAGVAVTILRYDLYDIDLIINRSLVYGTLTTIVFSIYIFAAAYLGSVVQFVTSSAGESYGHRMIPLIATGVVAVLFQPIRQYVQRGVNRLMYGERDEPYAVLSRFGRRLEETFAADAVLETIVETVREALKLPYAAIALWQDDRMITAAASGTLNGSPLRLPLTHQQEAVGELVLAPRGPGEVFDATDQRLLDDLVRQVGVAVHNVRLTSQMMQLNIALQRSREELVVSSEEERRRLRRELHDGLAPTLAALNLKAGDIRDLVRSDPDAAERVLNEWRAEVRQTIAFVRRLAYELRPPILDELGLIAAIHERASQSTLNQRQVAIVAPERLGPLPAAVELAAYRIIQEAITNVERHSHARSCTVRIWVCDELSSTLCLDVADDGCGITAESRHPPGIGLLSMRERAFELGGTCTIERGPDGGTRVVARLPIVREQGNGTDSRAHC